MKSKLVEYLEIPSDVSCRLEGHKLVCSSSSGEIHKIFDIPKVSLDIKDGKVIFTSEKGNKTQYKKIKSSIAHIKNLFHGSKEKFVYKLQSCNVHFPMTLKVDKDKLIINNFLGEKKPRSAEILPKVSVEVKGQDILVSSSEKDAAGQTAANIEKATKVRYRDRRVFQDGIYITEKPSGGRK